MMPFASRPKVHPQPAVLQAYNGRSRDATLRLRPGETRRDDSTFLDPRLKRPFAGTFSVCRDPVWVCQNDDYPKRKNHELLAQRFLSTLSEPRRFRGTDCSLL